MRKSKSPYVRTACVWLGVAAAIMLTASLAFAQETTPKAEIFAGYSWLHPGGRVACAGDISTGCPSTVFTPPLSTAPAFRLENVPGGGAVSADWNFNKAVGVQVDYNGHFNDEIHLNTIMVGPKLAWRTEHFTPFLEVLAGVGRLSPAGLGSHTGFAGAAGGGVDLWLTKRFAWRVLQVDYLDQNYKPNDIGGSGSFSGFRGQTGLVIGLGSLKPPVAPTAACSVQPTAVLAGEPITARVSTQNFNPKHTLTYNWKASGGTLTPKNQTATIDTTGLNPGSYTASATVSDPKGPKKYNVASCDTSFTINAPPQHPPTIACSANPTTVRSGDSSTINCQGSSPDNRPLTYQWSSSGGRVAGTAATGVLDTAGAPAGPITITTTVSDDRGLSASTTTTVNVELPPPAPQASKIGEIAFSDKKRPWRVDNTAKAILDDVALRLQREADAKAVVVGYFNPKEKGGVKLAEQRAVNTKAYLTEAKGIDPNRIEVRTGTAGGNRAEIYLVPAGATFNVSGTQTFDEKALKKQVFPKRGAHHHKTRAHHHEMAAHHS